MATITISTALVTDITDSVTYRNAADSTWEYVTGSGGNVTSDQGNYGPRANTNEKGSLLASYYTQFISNSYYTFLGESTGNGVKFEFKNAANTTLTTYYTTEIVSRSMDANGYCVLSNFPEKTPAAAGTIDYILISSSASSHDRDITLSVGPSGSGADVEFDDRTLVTTQPWRLDGVIKFRVPISYTWST